MEIPVRTEIIRMLLANTLVIVYEELLCLLLIFNCCEWLSLVLTGTCYIIFMKLARPKDEGEICVSVEAL